MVIGNNITSENLITVKELINNWQIASISKKKMFEKYESTQPDSTCDPINPFKNDPSWPANPIDPTWPTRFATSSNNMAANVTQPERSNIKYYALAFRFI